jgi:hypothetical protein
MELYCSPNKLSVAALNTLFRSLHSNTIADLSKLIAIDANPGAKNCDRTIATNKGWTFEYDDL